MQLTDPIETERLLLRAFTSADFDALYAYQSREDVTQHLYWGARTPDEVREALERKIGFVSIAEQGDVLCLAMERKETGAMIGDVILEFVSAEHRQGEIGYIVHPDHRGHGYVLEAARVLLQVAFEDLQLHRVIGRLEARNAASARVLEKLGMRREAHLVENEFVRGEWQSELVFAILDREWRAAGV